MNEVLFLVLLLVYAGLVARGILRGWHRPPTWWGLFTVSAALAGLAAGDDDWVSCVIWSASAAIWARVILVASREGDQQEPPQ